MQIKTTFYIGLESQSTKTQLIPTAAAVQVIGDVLFANGIEYATITESTGLYKYQNGSIAREASIKCEIIESLRATLQHKKATAAIIESLKKQLDQESIGIARALCFFNCR